MPQNANGLNWDTGTRAKKQRFCVCVRKQHTEIFTQPTASQASQTTDGVSVWVCVRLSAFCLSALHRLLLALTAFFTASLVRLLFNMIIQAFFRNDAMNAMDVE